MKKYAAIAAFASLSVVACNPPAGDPSADKNNDGIADATSVRGVDVVNQQAPSAPVGNILGVLRDAYTGAPIAKQDLLVASGRGVQLKATTDDSGGFLIQSVAFGSYGLSITKEGYVPVSTVLQTNNGGNLGMFPTDNWVNNLGDVYLLPSDSTMSVAVLTESGMPVANRQIIVDVAAAFNVPGQTPGANSNFFGRRTTLATTDAQGVAQVPGVPDMTKLTSILGGGNDYSVNVTCGPVDVNGDGIFDFAGRSGQAYNNQTYATDGVSKFSFVLSPANNNGSPGITASNTSNNNNNRPAVIATSDPLRFVFDRPILPGSIVSAVINDFARNTGGANYAYDNSSIGFEKESNPEPAYNYSTANTSLAPTLDPSGTVLTLTPTTAWPAGRNLLIILSVSSAQASGNAGDNSFWVLNALVKPAADALTVEQTMLERAKSAIATGYKYTGLVFGLNQPIIAPPTLGLRFCVDADLNNNGARETNALLDPNECPAAGATRPLNTADINRLGLFTRLDAGAANAPASTRYFRTSLNGAPSFPNLDLNGGVAALPDVYVLINPIVDGTFYDSNQQIALDAYRRPLQTQRVKVNFDVTKATLSQAAVGSAPLIANNQ